MDLLKYGRAMRKRGWAFRRREKGRWLFGTRFPNGKGTTLVVDTRAASLLEVTPEQLARIHSVQAASTCEYDPRKIA